ncbi:hypothetical protein CW354_13975 [Marinicaulis flavus]|uniref:Lipoprotein n=1 Tax=Hyphococcus luteus TaxID=2058213 RepID=A0A2S7K3Q7_9PROT|nr:hypothetical protein CW354_13975 [Marinicaulis flavus]
MFLYARIRFFLLCGTSFWLLAACSVFPKHHPETVATNEVAMKIKGGMRRLGASSARSECYANRISGALIESEAVEAAKLIESALSRDEMRDNVLAASVPIRKAFIRAHFGCSLSG